jgi:hypothetical protein
VRIPVLSARLQEEKIGELKKEHWLRESVFLIQARVVAEASVGGLWIYPRRDLY